MTTPVILCGLHGMGVLVTRPAHQAEGLCGWIEANGGRAIRFPAVEIRPAGSAEARRMLAAAGSYDWLVFVSANAVHHALPFLPEHRGDLQTAAVGESTARALAAAGFAGVLTPTAGADTEGLLALPAFARLNATRILIVRGHGGRTLLGDELRARGAVVDYAEVYDRVSPVVDAAPLLGRWNRDVDAVTVTSGEILDNLIAFLERDQRLFATPLVVISPRLADLAVRRGFCKVVTAAGPDERAIVAALCTLGSTG